MTASKLLPKEAKMSRPVILEAWTNLSPKMRDVLRIVAAFMFMQAGTIILFAIPMGMPPDGKTAEFMTQIWIGGVLETLGGALLLVGLFTRPVAFLLSGEMAVAYFQFHFPQGFWPIENNGVSAVIYCFVWLYFSAAGSGPWSLDAVLKTARNRRNR
jgi:putative oxidoreductase